MIPPDRGEGDTPRMFPFTRPRGSEAWPGCLLAFAGFRSRVEKKLAPLAGHIAGDGALARPRECLVHIGGFQYPKSAHVLLGLDVRSIGDEHLAVGLLPHRLCVGGRGNPAGELSYASSNHFAIKRVDLFHHCFGYGGRVEVAGKVVSNQILWHDFFFSCNGLYSLVFGGLVALPSRYSRTAGPNSTNCPGNFSSST